MDQSEHGASASIKPVTPGAVAALRRIDGWVGRLEKGLILTVFAALVGGQALTIIGRSLGVSLPWVMEACPSLVLWVALVGASAALGQGRHIRLELALRNRSPRTRRLAARVTGLFGLGVFSLLLISALTFVQNEIALFGAKGAFAAVFPLFFALAIFRQVRQIIDPAVPGDRPIPAAGNP